MEEIKLYFITAFVFLGIANAYIILEFTTNEIPIKLKQVGYDAVYERYSLDDWIINPFDYYVSKLEMYMLSICWLIGIWNFMDGFIILWKKKD